MGEAANRAKTDPTFGRIPKDIKDKKRGLVLSPPIEIKDGSFQLKSSELDPQELRFSLLFWDKFIVTKNNMIYIEPSDLERHLEKLGILSIKEYQMLGSIGIDDVGRVQLQALKDLEEETPNCWSLATGPTSFEWDKLTANKDRGFTLELYRAIPVPDKDVPIDEILEFREKRGNEICALRNELNSFELELKKENTNQAIAAKTKYIESACADLLKAGMEWKFPVRVSDLKCGFNFDLEKIVKGAGSGTLVGQQIGLPTVGALVGGAQAMLTLKADFKLQDMKPRSTPFKYVYDFHKELF